MAVLHRRRRRGSGCVRWSSSPCARAVCPAPHRRPDAVGHRGGRCARGGRGAPAV